MWAAPSPAGRNLVCSGLPRWRRSWRLLGSGGQTGAHRSPRGLGPNSSPLQNRASKHFHFYFVELGYFLMKANTHIKWKCDICVYIVYNPKYSALSKKCDVAVACGITVNPNPASMSQSFTTCRVVNSQQIVLRLIFSFSLRFPDLVLYALLCSVSGWMPVQRDWGLIF